MSIAVHLAADSVTPSGCRLTTWVLKYPRCIHSEVLTHRAFSRNSASSRAIPVSRMIQRVVEEPFIPHWWGKAQAGMQAGEEVDEATQAQARALWLQARDRTLALVRGEPGATGLQALDLHKQVINRLLEPWMHIEVVLSATEWHNWFLLRDDPSAEPHIRELAHAMRELYQASTPKARQPLPHGCELGAEEVLQSSGEKDWAAYWHLPFARLGAEDESTHTAQLTGGPAAPPQAESLFSAIKDAVAHCAWVSYLNEWREGYTQEDVERVYRRLLSAQPVHASPAEHVAVACDGPHRHGNFTGWCQWRKFLPNEAGGDYAG
ncbi:MAG: FAD-dependent thymidylate synthase [Chloroflexota bacterium]